VMNIVHNMYDTPNITRIPFPGAFDRQDMYRAWGTQNTCRIFVDNPNDRG
jgi:hypothetical protein